MPVHTPERPVAACTYSLVVPGRGAALTGRLDVTVAADVRLALGAEIADGEGDFVLDVSGLAALDATGLGVLVGAHRRAQRAGRTLVLLDPPAFVGRLLLRTRLDKVLRVLRTELDSDRDRDMDHEVDQAVA